jgi:asparagine synthase (glutamine-hydrolysing)
MCGITGYVSRGGVSREVVTKMATSLAHRGPDDAGIELFETVALGHRRLSIIDLTPRGHQPMVRDDAWLVFNGEVYNYLELRTELAAKGHTFTSDSDTEVVLAAYREWGHEALSRFNGMFAFAIWDVRKQELFCARDRLGVKPFYYWTGDGQFVFGSEIKALLAHPAVPRKPNPAIVYDYLAFKAVDHTDETFFDGIVRLPAGHYLVVRPSGARASRDWLPASSTAQGGAVAIDQRRWWSPAINDEIDASPKTRAQMIDRFAELCRDAVRLRLRADVPIGTCLSGGLDSSVIALVANQLIFEEHAIDRALIGQHQKTFSACFEDKRFDEREFIQLVLEATGAESYTIFPDADGFWRDLDKLLFHMDEPFNSTSQYSQHCVMRRVAQAGVKVTLDGQGADELLAGYPGYHSVWLGTLLARGHVPRALRELRATLAMGERGQSATELALRVGYGVLPFSSQMRKVLAPVGRLTSDARIGRVIRPELEQRFSARRAAAHERQNELMRDFPRRLHHDVTSTSLPPLLRYEDRNSMAFGIEARTPFLDYRLVEHAFALPMSLKISEAWTKRVLREAMNGVLPKPIQWRKDKKGFVTPEAIWMRAGKHRIRDVLSGQLASAEFLDGTAIRAVLDRELAETNETAFHTDVFRWLLLELWMRAMFR